MNVQGPQDIQLFSDTYPATPPLSIWLANVTSSDHTCKFREANRHMPFINLFGHLLRYRMV